MIRSVRAVETVRRGTYLRRVSFALLVRYLTMLALALSPLATTGAAPAAAMAHHAAMTAEDSEMADHEMTAHDMTSDARTGTMAHCNDMDGKSNDEPCRSGDCLAACAAVPAIAAFGAQLELHGLARGLSHQSALGSVPHGLVPEAATPPPRGRLKI